MIYLSSPIFESTADGVILPVSGTEDIPEGSLHEKFLSELDLSYCEHYFREVKLDSWAFTPATCSFIREGEPWYHKWVVEMPCLPEDRFHTLSPRVHRAAYLVNKLGLKTVAVSHLNCKISRNAQEILWQWVENQLDGVEIHLHTQEYDDAEQPAIVLATQVDTVVGCA
jgi:hypothetical protein